MTRIRPPIALDGPTADGLEALLADPRLWRLAPFFHLQSENDEDVPAEIRRRLRSRYRQTIRRNLLLHRELLRALEAVGGAGIAAIPLKGTMLGLRLYRDLGRPSADVDLLVRDADVPGALEVLADLGYAAGVDQGKKDVILRRPGRGLDVYLELHRWLMAHPTRAALPFHDRVWRRATPCDAEGVAHWRMAPADELVYLCLNLVLHRFLDPFLALDVHLAVESWRRRIDWSDLASAARRFRFGSQVAVALLFARRWFGTELPIGPRELGLARWKELYFRRAEWPLAPARLASRLPLGVHAHRLGHLMVVDETWGDRREHLGYAARSVPRIARRLLGLPPRPVRR